MPVLMRLPVQKRQKDMIKFQPFGGMHRENLQRRILGPGVGRLIGLGQ